MMLTRSVMAVALSCALLVGCQARPAPGRASSPPVQPTDAGAADQPTTLPADGFFEALVATVVPPDDWAMTVKVSTRHNIAHYVWVSPSGNTAFGIMRFALPLPMPHEPVLWVFMTEMRKSEGDATLLDKVWDRNLRGIRFQAEGGRYLVRTNFTIRGLTGWMAYAGTHRDQPVNEAELRQAVAAREGVQFGRRKPSAEP